MANNQPQRPATGSDAESSQSPWRHRAQGKDLRNWGTASRRRKPGEQSEVDVYDPGTNTWTLAASMPRPIGHIMADVFVRSGRIDIASGVTLRSVKLANVIEYDPLKNTWSELPSLPKAHEGPLAGLVGNQIVVTCGALPIP